jgi:transposase
MQGSMENYPRAAVERAMAKKITWWQAGEIIGISARQMRRWRERYEEHGYDGLMDRRRGKASSRQSFVESFVDKVSWTDRS